MSSHEIVFRCKLLDSSSPTCIDGKKTLAVKGFASRIDPRSVLHPDFVALTYEYDALSFDGDDLDSKSFTKMIAAIAYERVMSEPGFCLMAVKYEEENEQFLRSWDNRAVSFSSTESELTMNAKDSPSDSAFPVYIYYRLISESPDNPKTDISGNGYYR